MRKNNKPGKSLKITIECRNSVEDTKFFKGTGIYEILGSLAGDSDAEDYGFYEDENDEIVFVCFENEKDYFFYYEDYVTNGILNPYIMMDFEGEVFLGFKIINSYFDPYELGKMKKNILKRIDRDITLLYLDDSDDLHCRFRLKKKITDKKNIVKDFYEAVMEGFYSNAKEFKNFLKEYGDNFEKEDPDEFEEFLFETDED